MLHKSQGISDFHKLKSKFRTILKITDLPLKRNYKYYKPDLDFLNVDLTLMERYNVLDLNDGSTQVKELGPKADVDQDVAEDENDPSTPDTLMSPEPNVVNPINVSPD